MGDHRKLKAWQRARALNRKVYLATRDFPADELYGLRLQIRKASISIMPNLAEGCGRNGDRELLRFVSIAQGSASELDAHLTATLDVEIGDPSVLARLQEELAEIRRMLSGLADRLRPND